MCPFDTPKTQLGLRSSSPHLRAEVCLSLLKFDLPVFSLELLKNYVLGGVFQ